MEKAQLIGFVGGDDKLIGYGRQTLDKTADEGRPAKGTVAFDWPMRRDSPPAWMTTVTRGRT